MRVLLLPVWIPFISLSSLISVAKTSKTMLNSSVESGHPCLVPDFRENAFSFSPLRTMFAVGLSYMAFIMLRYVPSMSQSRTLANSSTENPIQTSFSKRPLFSEVTEKLYKWYTQNISVSCSPLPLSSSPCFSSAFLGVGASCDTL